MVETPTSLSCVACGASAPFDAPCCPACDAALSTIPCPTCRGLLFAGDRSCSRCGAETSRVLREAPRSRLCPRCGIGLRDLHLGGSLLKECPDCGGLWADLKTFGTLCGDAERQAELLQQRDAVLASPPAEEGAAGGLGPYRENAAPARRRTPGDEALGPIHCPECGARMKQSEFAEVSEVMVDACQAHGLWFDKDELRQVMDFVREGGLNRDQAFAEILEERRRWRRAAETRAAMQDGKRFDDVTVWDVIDFALALLAAAG